MIHFAHHFMHLCYFIKEWRLLIDPVTKVCTLLCFLLKVHSMPQKRFTFASDLILGYDAAGGT